MTVQDEYRTDLYTKGNTHGSASRPTAGSVRHVLSTLSNVSSSCCGISSLRFVVGDGVGEDLLEVGFEVGGVVMVGAGVDDRVGKGVGWFVGNGVGAGRLLVGCKVGTRVGSTVGGTGRGIGKMGVGS